MIDQIDIAKIVSKFYRAYNSDQIWENKLTKSLFQNIWIKIFAKNNFFRFSKKFSDRHFLENVFRPYRVFLPKTPNNNRNRCSDQILEKISASNIKDFYIFFIHTSKLCVALVPVFPNVAGPTNTFESLLQKYWHSLKP